MVAVTRNKRNTGLDAVRGVAIILVVASHFLPLSIGHALIGPERTQILAEYLAYGGVILFFLLSGFLMEQTTAAEPNLFSFAVRRAARILPMYWASILLAQFIVGPFDTKTIVSNAVFASDLTHTALMLGVYWTLYVEVRFYVIVPILRFAGETAIKTAPYAAIALNGILFTHSGHASHLVLYTTYCLAGMQISLWQRQRLGIAPLAICLGIVSASASIYTPEHSLVGMAPVLGAAMLWLALKKDLTAPALAFVGRVSYSWYLLHSPIGRPIIGFMIENGSPDWAAALTTAALTLGIAALTFYFVESPAIKTGKIIAERARRIGIAAR